MPGHYEVGVYKPGFTTVKFRISLPPESVPDIEYHWGPKPHPFEPNFIILKIRLDVIPLLR
jgi:hypothetical protein